VAARLEVFLFDFDEDLYGQVIATELVEFIREEATFEGMEPLKRQIARDVVAARSLLGLGPPTTSPPLALPVDME
jgi:riboflavin kinase/FMN adenylyltransferase